MKTEPRQKRRR